MSLVRFSDKTSKPAVIFTLAMRPRGDCHHDGSVIARFECRRKRRAELRRRHWHQMCRDEIAETGIASSFSHRHSRAGMLMEAILA